MIVSLMDTISRGFARGMLEGWSGGEWRSNEIKNRVYFFYFSNTANTLLLYFYYSTTTS